MINKLFSWILIITKYFFELWFFDFDDNGVLIGEGSRINLLETINEFFIFLIIGSEELVSYSRSKLLATLE